MNKPQHPPFRKCGGSPGEVAHELGVSDWSLNCWHKEKEMEQTDVSPPSVVRWQWLTQRSGIS